MSRWADQLWMRVQQMQAQGYSREAALSELGRRGAAARQRKRARSRVAQDGMDRAAKTWKRWAD